MKEHVRTLAVVMTCHNRREKTLGCLSNLAAQSGIDQLRVNAYVVDDGSTDGTGAAIRELFPNVIILQGDGSLYWNGGMRKAIDAAMREGFDFYLWLNDDTVLDADALGRLLKTFDDLESLTHMPSIIVGSIRDPETRQLTYGGSRHVSRFNPLRVELVVPSDMPQRCDVFNGNVVLVPRGIAESLGNLSRHFKHRAGDYEFSLRAREAGFVAWVAPHYFGQCARNSIAGTWRDPLLPRRTRIKKIISPTGMPMRERLYFVYRFGGIFWPVYFISVYVRFIVGLFGRSEKQ